MELSAQQRVEFLEATWEHYARYGRHSLPWRQRDPDGSFDPYKVLCSELMLQQTQVSRVIPKYYDFLHIFPTVDALAAASLGDVLRLWQGLGYNRRAKFLRQSAQLIRERGRFPDTLAALVALPGVGLNTAGAILAYAFNRPTVFIETNIRTVYIHHFFHDRVDVSDKEISRLVEQTLDYEQPREFYWALMDYGSYLKATIGNVSQASKHYTKQSRFHGSRRQIRGLVLRQLGERPHTATELAAIIPDERLETILIALVAEGLIRKNAEMYSLD